MKRPTLSHQREGEALAELWISSDEWVRPAPYAPKGILCEFLQRIWRVAVNGTLRACTLHLLSGGPPLLLALILNLEELSLAVFHENRILSLG